MTPEEIKDIRERWEVAGGERLVRSGPVHHRDVGNLLDALGEARKDALLEAVTVCDERLRRESNLLNNTAGAAGSLGRHAAYTDCREALRRMAENPGEPT